MVEVGPKSDLLHGRSVRDGKQEVFDMDVSCSGKDGKNISTSCHVHEVLIEGMGVTISVSGSGTLLLGIEREAASQWAYVSIDRIKKMV